MWRPPFLIFLMAASIAFQVCDGVSLVRIKRIFNDLRNKTKDSLDKSFMDFGHAADQIDENSAEHKSDGTKQLEEAFQKFDVQIASLDLPDRLKQCLIKNLTFWHLESVNELTTCVNNKTAQALDFVRDSVVTVASDAISVLIEDQKNIMSCDVKDEKCLDDIAVKTEKDLRLAPGNIDMNVASLLYTVKEKRSFIYNCASMGVQKRVEAMEEIVNTPTLCAS